jgi:hypothetical protein
LKEVFSTAQDFSFIFSATGPAEERERLKRAIETHATKQGDGEYFVSTEEALGSPDAREGFFFGAGLDGAF